MPLFKQLELEFASTHRAVSTGGVVAVAGQTVRLSSDVQASGTLALQFRRKRDYALESSAADLLCSNGARPIASLVRVEWNPRLKTCAGRADFKEKLISLNPMLLDHGADEIDRTFRHELAHLLAQFRAARKRILPHGPEWRKACQDLGIGDEKRCHTLPFPVQERARHFLYRCLNCRRDFPRARRIGRAVACLACCLAHNGGGFDKRFKLRLVNCSGGL
jgi:SprT protein